MTQHVNAKMVVARGEFFNSFTKSVDIANSTKQNCEAFTKISSGKNNLCYFHHILRSAHLQIPRDAVPLHCVFHGIRFLKLEDWSSG